MATAFLIIAVVICALFQVGSSTRVRGAIFGFLGSTGLLLVLGVGSGHWDFAWQSYAYVVGFALLGALLTWWVASLLAQPKGSGLQ
jgi:hypothetical protein